MSGKDTLDLSQWYNAREAADRLGTTQKYVATLAREYKKFKRFSFAPHLMLYWKADVDAYCIRPRRNKQPA